MAKKSSVSVKQNFFLWLCVAFVLGFVVGIAFTVFKLDPSSTSTTGTNQVAQQQTNQQSQAILNLESQVTENPENAETWEHLGHLYYDSNQQQKAIGAYTKVLELGGGDANLYTDLGVMYRRTDQPQKAIEMFNKSMELDSTHQYSRLNKGIVLLYDLNEPEKAFKVWEDLLKINPQIQLANGMPLSESMKQMKKDLAKQQ